MNTINSILSAKGYDAAQIDEIVSNQYWGLNAQVIKKFDFPAVELWEDGYHSNDESLDISAMDKELEMLAHKVPASSEMCDVHFNDSETSNNKGFALPFINCMNYIQSNNGTNDSYFADFKGGIVEVYNNETEEVVYTEEVK